MASPSYRSTTDGACPAEATVSSPVAKSSRQYTAVMNNPGAMRSLGRSVVEFKKGVKETDSEDGRIEDDSTKEEKTA